MPDAAQSMRIALVLTPINERNLQLAAQVGATDIVGRYPGSKLADLKALQDRVTSFGLKLAIIEGYVPHDRIVHGAAGRDEQIENFKQLIRNMGELGMDICCYNFMPDDDWARTSTTIAQRGGALVTGFDVESPMFILNKRDAESYDDPPMTHDRLWANLHYFLEQIVPVAEAAGVKLALHPDDPPMSPLGTHQQIMTGVAAFEKMVKLVPSKANGICFCQGCFSEMGEDVPAAITRLGEHIHYVHFRDVRGCASYFEETFHDNGQTDMAAAMRAYRAIGFKGPMRPDHVPVLAGEDNDQPGYTMQGRLFAVGYIKGLMDATI
jgi:mannonate dehydratase